MIWFYYLTTCPAQQRNGLCSVPVFRGTGILGNFLEAFTASGPFWGVFRRTYPEMGFGCELREERVLA